MHGRKNVFRSAIFVIGAVIVTGCGDARPGQQEPESQGYTDMDNTDILDSSAELSLDCLESGEDQPPEASSEQQEGREDQDQELESSPDRPESSETRQSEPEPEHIYQEPIMGGVPVLPATGQTLSDFVAEGWKLIDSVELDYNEDGVTDYVGVQEALNGELSGRGGLSGLRILFGVVSEGAGQYRLDFQDENLIPTLEEGGPFGDPFEPLTAEGTSFTVSALGGSAWKWFWTYTFTYRDGDWYLAEAGEDDWFMGPCCTFNSVTDDWETGVRTRCIQSDDRGDLERRMEEQEGEDGEIQYDLVYDMRLDEPPTLLQAGRRGSLALDRVTDWEVREIVFAEGTDLTLDAIDIVTPKEAGYSYYYCYYDENCMLYTFFNREQENLWKYYLAMYRWQDKSLTIMMEGDGYPDISDPILYRDKIYYSETVMGEVSYYPTEGQGDPVREQRRVGVRLKRIDLDGTGGETVFEYLCPGLEQQPLPEEPPWIRLRVRDISGGEIVVQVETDGPDPVYRMNVDGSDMRQIGQIPKE